MGSPRLYHTPPPKSNDCCKGVPFFSREHMEGSNGSEGTWVITARVPSSLVHASNNLSREL